MSTTEKLKRYSSILNSFILKYHNDEFDKKIIVAIPYVNYIFPILEEFKKYREIHIYLYGFSRSVYTGDHLSSSEIVNISVCMYESNSKNQCITDPSLISKIDYLIYDDEFNVQFNEFNLLVTGTRIIGSNNLDTKIIESHNLNNINFVNELNEVKIIKNDIKYHVYVIGVNDSKYLKHVFKHYHDSDKIVVVDNCSSDDTANITKEYGKTLISFNTDGYYDFMKIKEFKNNIWKHSREVDYVIVHSINELLYLGNDIKEKMFELKKNKVTVIKSSVRNIYCDDLKFNNIPEDQYITTSLFEYIDEKLTDEVVCFSPSDIDEINYCMGSTNFDPKGNVKIENYGLIFKYTYTGLQNYIDKYNYISSKISPKNKLLNIGIEYTGEIKMPNLKCIGDLFNAMYDKNIARITINNKTCIIDTLDNDLISKKIKSGKIWNENVYTWLSNNVNENTIYIDIGSHIGTYIAYAKLLGVKKIYGFESSEKLCQKINSTIKLNGWNNIMIFDRLIGKKSEEVDVVTWKDIDIVLETKKVLFSEDVNDFISTKKIISLDSILNTTTLSLSHNLLSSVLKYEQKNEDIATPKTDRSMTPYSLDNDSYILNLEKYLFISIPNDEINDEFIIKISIEGHEYDALLGMKKLLTSNNVKLLIEINYKKIYMDKVISMLDFLKNLNYTNSILVNKIDGSDTEQLNYELYSDSDYILIDQGLGQYEYFCPIGAIISFGTIKELILQEYNLIIAFSKPIG